MADDKLIADLQRIREDIVRKRGACLSDSASRREAVEQAKENLLRADAQEQRAVRKGEDIKTEQKRLIDYVNALTTKSQVVLERIDKLGADQLVADSERKGASEIKRQRQAGLEQANTDLALAEADLKKVESDLADIDGQLRQLRGY